MLKILKISILISSIITFLIVCGTIFIQGVLHSQCNYIKEILYIECILIPIFMIHGSVILKLEK